MRWWSIGYWAWWWGANKAALGARARAAVRTPAFWLRFAAYALPLAFLLYVLYINYLPFGYNKTFTITVGAPGDTSGAFYLAPSRDLSDRMTDANGTPYRTLNGTAYAVFSPGVVLKNATINVSVQSNPPGSLQIIPPQINFDPSIIKWDYAWDFATSTPSDLTGGAFHFDNCEAFDGTSQLQLPNSANEFESGPFTVYVEWTPQDNTDNFQEIVGHYNWELLQNKTSVSFQVGRMNNAQGPFYSITYPIADPTTFFNTKHTALAIYNPSTAGGYIELYVDGNLAGQSSFGTSTIWTDYNGKQNLTFGKAGHGEATYFRGCEFQVDIENNSTTNSVSASFEFSGIELEVPIESAATTTLNSIKLDAH